jgi:hypothetical protein
MRWQMFPKMGTMVGLERWLKVPFDFTNDMAYAVCESR